MFKFISGLLVGLVLGISYSTPPTSQDEFTPVSYKGEVEPERAALKLGDKLHCSEKSYTLKEKVWTWTCVTKNKQRAYSLVHPDFAFDLLVASDRKCAVKNQLWFVSAPNDWAIAARSRSGVATRDLAMEVKKRTGGLTFYVCR
jgi:hypothetical protein